MHDTIVFIIYNKTAYKIEFVHNMKRNELFEETKIIQKPVFLTAIINILHVSLHLRIFESS